MNEQEYQKMCSKTFFRFRAKVLKDCDMGGGSTSDVMLDFVNNAIMKFNTNEDIEKHFRRVEKKLEKYLNEYGEWGSSTSDLCCCYLSRSIANTLSEYNAKKA